MKRRLLIAAAATSLMALPSLAHAQGSGVYIKGQIGYGTASDTDVVVGDNATNGLLGDLGSPGNLAYGLGLGYDLGENWRIELDGSVLDNDFGTIGGQPNTNASLNVSSLMLNLLYDFSDFGRWEPYVGAGVGVAQGDANLSAHDFLNPTGAVIVPNPACVTGAIPGVLARTCEVNDKDSNVAWNLLAGVGYEITDNLTWDTNYRYMDAGDFDFDGDFIGIGLNGQQSLADLEATIEDVGTHTIMTGFRYRFGKSAAPVVVTPPPAPTTYTCWDGVTEVTDRSLCPARPVSCWDGSEAATLDLCPPEPVMLTCPDGVTMVSDLAACPIIQPVAQCGEQFRQDIIYYEFDRAQSAETRNAINRVLDVGQFCAISSIRVVGHTDTSGSMAYNQRLSERRAADAVSELVRQGVDNARITSEGRGETQPAVQTGDGVRNQQNRRTEVLITLSELGTAMMTN